MLGPSRAETPVCECRIRSTGVYFQSEKWVRNACNPSETGACFDTTSRSDIALRGITVHSNCLENPTWLQQRKKPPKSPRRRNLQQRSQQPKKQQPSQQRKRPPPRRPQPKQQRNPQRRRNLVSPTPRS